MSFFSKYHWKWRNGLLLFAAIATHFTVLGCANTPISEPGAGNRWNCPPQEASQNTVNTSPTADQKLQEAWEAYQTARQAERNRSASCVDWYYHAAMLSWPFLQQTVELQKDTPWRAQAAEIYNESVVGLLKNARRYGRYQAPTGIRIQTTTGPAWIPMTMHFSPWFTPEVYALYPVTPGDELTASDRLQNLWGNDGWGVPSVGLYNHTGLRGPEAQFLEAMTPFPVTALLRPGTIAQPGKGNDIKQVGAVLELRNPFQETTVEIAGKSVPLARNLSAHYAKVDAFEGRRWLQEFLLPGVRTDTDGLHFVEPYQSGKIPVVLVHGLLSDPTTWADLINTFSADPVLNKHYQFWTFGYPTGKPFLDGAAKLRADSRKVMAILDPEGKEPALQQWVLIGHSMGGLVSKLQVTSSQDALWKSVANQPIQNLKADAKTRQDLQERFFFEPSPFISQVIYVATPHNGSSLARRWYGRFSSWLVKQSEEDQFRLQQTMANNPGLFNDRLRNGIPTSVDLLEPNNWLLNTISVLPESQKVRKDSIIGTGRPTLIEGPGDGVVPVSSARIRDSASETYIRARHTEIQRDPQTMARIRQLLIEHLQRTGRLPTR